MRFINATRKRIVYEDVKNLRAIEITSMEQFEKLKRGTNVAVMHNCFMILGKKDGFDTHSVDIGTELITIRPDRFAYGNSMYEILELEGYCNG